MPAAPRPRPSHHYDESAPPDWSRDTYREGSPDHYRATMQRAGVGVSNTRPRLRVVRDPEDYRNTD